MDSKDKLSDNQRVQLAKVGDRLRALRVKKGYSNYETFAFEHGLNRANYGRYEAGNNLRLDTLIKILECHEMTLDEFFRVEI